MYVCFGVDPTYFQVLPCPVKVDSMGQLSKNIYSDFGSAIFLGFSYLVKADETEPHPRLVTYLLVRSPHIDVRISLN